MRRSAIAAGRDDDAAGAPLTIESNAGAAHALPHSVNARGMILAFSSGVFASAGLLFTVQPMFAKMALPLLGGAPGVWSVALVFFQAALLVGYGYAHLLARLRSLPMQAAIHCGVLALAALSLPLGLSHAVGQPTDGMPAFWLLALLTLSVGAPFAALSATAPLLQSWYARTRQADAGDPYHLYVASNLGSLVSLLAYPLAIEPLLGLGQQSAIWSFGFVATAAGILGCAALAARDDTGRHETPASVAIAPGAKWRERAIWIGLAAVPSSLLVGATTHITTDVAAAPFLWVPPLFLYLVTFTLAFSKRRIIPYGVTSKIYEILGLAMAPLVGLISLGLTLGIAADLTVLFFAALLCHQALAARRPHVSRLTEFYLFLSLGGVLGGFFNAIVAPAVFTSIIEYPLAVMFALLALAPLAARQTRRQRLWTFAILALIATSIAIAALTGGKVTLATLVLGMTACLVMRFILRAPAAYFAAGCALLIGATIALPQLKVELQDRSFFGLVRVTVDANTNTRRLVHGTTVHGSQSLTPGDELRPLTYYAHETPIGQVFRTLGKDHAIGTVGIVGLGAGSTACYRQTGESFTYYEINPLVAEVARNPAFFTFLSHCAPDAPIVIGDARLTLAKAPESSFDLLLLDAFSSDVVPAHLLTREAMALYLSRMKAGGIIVFHVSNRFMDLKDTLARVVEAEGAVMRFQVFRTTKEEAERGVTSSDVAIIARNPAALAAFDADPRWASVAATQGAPWTDDYSNVLEAIFARMNAPDS